MEEVFKQDGWDTTSNVFSVSRVATNMSVSAIFASAVALVEYMTAIRGESPAVNPNWQLDCMSPPHLACL